jgi:hypothetical protein
MRAVDPGSCFRESSRDPTAPAVAIAPARIERQESERRSCFDAKNALGRDATP